MHLHILGIGGTFMAGLAAIARESGHRVTGADGPLYPPMSTQLEELGIEIITGYDPEQLELGPDVVVVGNVMRRGMPIIETLLDSKLAYTSGPAWLAEHVLSSQWVLAVAGTHGKTTTTSLLAWLMDSAGQNPGFLVGGIPANFGVSARLGGGDFFVIEADEYDTAFFDKQAKFLHYGPRTLIINNIEFDHADIYKDLDAICWQFHQLIRKLPPSARLAVPADDPVVARLLSMGCWSGVDYFAAGESSEARLLARPVPGSLELELDHKALGQVPWAMSGAHNAENAAAALLAALHAGADEQICLRALSGFRGVARRQEHLGCFSGVDVYDDFAHHPTAIRRTLEGFCQGSDRRVLVLLEPRSNTMRMGVHQQELLHALESADSAWVYQREDLDWDVASTLAAGRQIRVSTSIDEMVEQTVAQAGPGDRIIIMSNGGFEGIQERLTRALANSSG